MATVLDELLVRMGFDVDVSGANTFDDSLNKVISTVGRASAVVVGFGTVVGTALGKGFLDTAVQFENFETQLTTIEGSAEKAKESLDWISEFGAKTPYDVAQVTDAFVKLKSYGLDPIEDGLLTSLGNMSSAMGKPLEQAVEMIADAVRGENERLKEFGIIGSKGNNEITYSYDINGEQFSKTVANSSDAIQAALQEIMDEKFRGGMEAMSKTWEGTMSNLGDTWTMMKRRIMERGVFQRLKESLNEVMLKIYDNREAIDKWADRVGDKLVVAFDNLKEVLFDVWDYALWARDGIKALTDGLMDSKYGLEVVTGLVGLFVANLVGMFAINIAGKIMTIAQAFIALASPITLIGAVLLLLLLAIEDIYGYLNGKDSLIGELIKDYPVINDVLNLVLMLVDAIKRIWTDNQSIFSDLGSALSGLVEAFGPIIALIASVMPDVFGLWLNIAIAVIDVITTGVLALVKIFTILSNIISAIVKLITGDMSSSFGDTFSSVIKQISKIFRMISALSKAGQALFRGEFKDAFLTIRRSFVSSGEDDNNKGVSGKSALAGRGISNNSISNTSTVTQHINVASANEAAIVANNTNQAQRQRTYGYQ